MGTVLAPRDASAIAAWLGARLRELERGELSIRASAVGIEPYHRRALAGRFARVFRDAVARARLQGRGRAIGMS
jgi:hypothetical protein